MRSDETAPTCGVTPVPHELFGHTGIRKKAARGELRRGLPIGLVWGEQDGEVLFHPDEAVTGAIRTVFERFAEFGSARRVSLWFRSEGLLFPLQARSRWPAWPDPLDHSDLHSAPSHPDQSGVCWRLHLRTAKLVEKLKFEVRVL